MTLTGSNTWTGGTLAGNGSVDVTSTGAVALSGAVAGTLSTSLTNAGAITIGGTGGLNVSAPITNSGTFTDNSTGTITITTPFVNQGGTINADTGTLSIQSNNCTWTGGGTLAAAAGATLQLAPSEGADNGIILTGSYTGSGAGTVELTTGALAIGSGGATFDFPKGLFQWQGGSINVNRGGTLTNTGFLTLNNSSGITLGAPNNFINQGEVDQTGTGNLAIASGTFDNQAGATYDISGTGGVTTGPRSSGTFSDEGTLKMTGSGTAAISVFSALNGGTIDVQSGTLSIQSTNCNWTGGNFKVASARHPRSGTRCRQRHHHDGHLHRFRRRRRRVNLRHALDQQQRSDVPFPSGPLPVAGRHHQPQSRRNADQHRLSDLEQFQRRLAVCAQQLHQPG